MIKFQIFQVHYFVINIIDVQRININVVRVPFAVNKIK